MDNRIGEMETFVAVVEAGSLAGAAQRMRITPSAVSRSIARLEARLGVRLLQRTTRSVVPTHEGEAFYARAVTLLADLDEVERCFAANRAEPRGRLRVNANVPYAMQCLIPKLPKLLARHPALSIDLTLTDNVVDLLAERADVAIRFGPLPDSTLHARNLGRTSMVVVAAPAYLKRHGVPKRPEDLERHPCIGFNFRRTQDGWPFRMGGSVRVHSPPMTVVANSGDAVRAMALAGLGIARIGRFQVLDDIRQKRLVPLFERLNPGDTSELNALYASQQHLSVRIRAFIDFLVEHASVNC